MTISEVVWYRAVSVYPQIEVCAFPDKAQDNKVRDWVEVGRQGRQIRRGNGQGESRSGIDGNMKTT